MAESEGAFRLTFVQGRGLLSLAGRDFEGLGRVDSLELEIPNLRFPFDLSGGVARFKNRRLRLRELALFVGSRELTGFLARAPLAEFGIFDPRVTVAGSRLTLRARVQLGGHECEITAAALVSPQSPRSAGLCVYDVRAYGFLPIPAPLVVTALFSALGAESPANADSTPAFALPPLLHIRSAADIRIDVCELAMLAILPMHGWRLPERKHVQIRVAGGAAKATHVPLLFSLAEPDAPADLLLGEEASPDAYPMREFADRCAPIENALARGDIASALEQLNALAPLDVDDRVGTTRLLQLLLAGESTLDQAAEVAQSALDRWPEFLPGLLALAVLAAVRNRPGDAAVLFERVAELSAAQGRGEDESCALLAAARQLAASGQSDRALLTLERALVGRSCLRPVARAKVMKQAVAGNWKDILATIGEESVVGEPDVRDEVAQVLELVRQGGLAKDTELVAQAAASLESLLSRNEWPETALSQADAAYQMGLVRLTLGDDQAASHWFAACIEGDASGVTAAAAWQALVELLHRQGDPASMAQALSGWAGDARVPESADEKIGHLMRAAHITWQDLHAPDRAAALLESALGLAPANANVLAELERLAVQSGRPEGVIAILRRHLRETRPDQGKAVLRVLIRLLVEAGNQRADAKEACAVLLDLSPGDDEAVFHLARLGWDAGERADAGAGYRRSTAAHTLSPARLAEAHLRTAQLDFAEGALDEAERHLALALASEPHGARIEVLDEALHALGRDEQLRDLLTARESALSDQRERRQVRRSLAAAAERKGNLDEAEAIYRDLLESHSDDVDLLDRMAFICRRQSRHAELAGWLEKLWGAVEREGLSEQGAELGVEQGLVDGMAVGMDLAALLARTPEGRPRAEAILRELLERVPDSPALLDSLHALLMEKGEIAEASKLLAQRLAITPEAEVPALLLGRAHLCLAQLDGARSALALLQTLAVEKLSEEALSLRADLAEKAGEILDAVLCLQHLRMRGTDETRADLTRRLTEVVSQPAAAKDVAIAVLEKLQLEVPDNLVVAKALFEAYGRLDDMAARNLAWQDLLAKAPALPDVYRARLQVALSEAAEREGDLQAAEQMLDKAAQLDHSPRSRVDQLVVHARLLLARGEILQAQDELEEALSINADSPAALALVADLAYRAQEWEKARKAYTRLSQIPGAGAVLSAHTLAYRRAELAEMFGDHAEAEAAYREVVTLDPEHDGAREALAGFALLRGDLAEAALHLQEVVRLVPKESIDRLTQIRQRLGQVFLGLGDLQAARQNLGLALASEPDRASTLELLATCYGRLGLHRDAAAMCERLARTLTDPSKKAEVLFRKGEILRSSLADVEGANEAFLRACDLDPSFAPTLGRLVAYYWARADLPNLADVGADLVSAAPIPRADQDDLGLLVAVAALLARHDEELAQSALTSVLLGAPLRADLAAKRLGELVARIARADLGALDAVLAFLRAAMKPGFETELAAAAMRGLANDPGDAGLAMVLARVLERTGRIGLARSAYCLAHFIDADIGAGKRLAELGEATTPRSLAFEPGQAIHPLCRGPLRRVLHHLARALASAGPAAYDEPAAPLLPETVALCEWLRTRLGAPPVPIVAQGHGVDVTFTATQPLSILIGRRAESLAAADLRFFVARALEQARAGTLAVLRMSPDNLRGMLRAVLRVAGAPGTPFEIAEEATDDATSLWLTRLRQPEIAALIPTEAHMDDLIADASHALADPPDLDDYIRGCRYTADRVGLLVCGRPLSGLRALAGLLKDGSGGVETATVEHRQEQVRASQAMRELVAFMVSEEYGALVDDV
jgi:tetratricopeptide (TPR) repeat protein